MLLLMAFFIVFNVYPLLEKSSWMRLMLRLRASSSLDSLMARLIWEYSTALFAFHGCADSACRMMPADIGLMYSSVTYFPVFSTMIGIEPLSSEVSMVNCMVGWALLMCWRYSWRLSGPLVQTPRTSTTRSNNRWPSGLYPKYIHLLFFGHFYLLNICMVNFNTDFFFT